MKKTATLLIVLLIGISSLLAQVQVDKFTGDVSYGLPLITIPNFRGPSVSTSISYRSDIKVDQAASEVGLGWNINAGGSIERIVNGVPDDWKDVFVPDMQAASFQNHLGALYLDYSSSSSTVLDFNYTRYKMDTLNDTLRYYYPDYDTYFVTGAGMTGKISPENYDFPTVTIDTSTVNRWFFNDDASDSISIGIREIETYSLTDNFFNYGTHFRYQHNMYDEVDAELYPWDESPLTSTSPIYITSDTTSSPLYNGTGYNDESYSVSANKNRTRTSNYIEYFTNSDIDAGVTAFMEYDTTFARDTEANFPQDGIGAYRITDPNGYTYHYSLPVYAHYSHSGNYNLDKDYTVLELQGGIMDILDSTHGYIVENDQTYQILEIKQTKKYAARWLLTAITGPDFEDTNSNGIVDLADNGYWVKYDYGLWTESYVDRFPYYGSRYSFSSSIEEYLGDKFLDENMPKNNGKSLSFSETANQVYYLNQIQTPSHTGIFCRDLRYDEQSIPIKFTGEGSSITIDNTVDSVYLTDDYGDGRLTSKHPEASFSHTLLIKPTGYNSTYDVIDVEFQLLNCALDNEFSIIVFDGDEATGDTLLTRENDDGEGDYPGSEGGIYNFEVTSGEILVKFTVDTAVVDDTKTPDLWYPVVYDIDWNTRWENGLPGWPAGRQQTTPNIKLSKLFLFDNDDLDSLPAISVMDSVLNDKLWNYNDVNRATFYNSAWYTANQTTIDGLALQSVDLDQDYSLAQNYHNSRYTLVYPSTNSSTPIEVEANKYVDTNNTASSGKLTLNKVIYYGLNRTQTQPSHLLDYNASNSTDNPVYNHLLQDYWGNYKSDADTNLLRGYVTSASKTGTDAWSLRKVTSPLGGTTDIVYESDEYEQVLTEDKDGNIRGPLKTFVLKDVYAVDGDIGGQWTFNVENQTDEFWDTKDNLPTGATDYTTIPCVWINVDDSTSDGHYQDIYPEGGFAVSYGDGILTETGSKVDALSYYDLNFDSTLTYIPPLLKDSHVFYSNTDSLVYAGGGYVSFQYPVGEKINGGGTRVKELRVSNGVDIYTVAYTYDEGTATSEAGDFSKRKSKIDAVGNNYDWTLTSYDYNPFGMSPQVGYGKVTIENKGQATSGQGKSIFSFNVSDDNRNHFEPYDGRTDTSWTRIGSSCIEPFGDDGTTTNIKYGIEIIDNFTTIWGKIKEQTLEDVNDNMVSKKVYEYETSTNGAHVSTVNFNIDEIPGCDDTLTYIACIFRTYPNYLKKVITYSNGRKSESEIIARDPFTGDPIETKNTSINGTESREEITLAYTQSTTPDYSTMGAKSDDPSNDNFLNGSYSSKTYKTSEGLTTPDFSSYGKSFWKDSVTTRYYDTTDDEYKTKLETVNEFDYTKYAYVGDLGEYGLFDSTAFTDISAPPGGASDWRFITEITLMDEEQNVLEQKGYNDRFSASKLGYDNRFTYTSASNSNYVSFTACGFETETEVESGTIYYEGEISSQTNDRIKLDGNVYPHTGNYMVKIPSANRGGPQYDVNYDATAGIESLQRGRTYIASVWVHKDSPNDTKLLLQIEGDTASTTYSESDTMSIAHADAIQIGDWIQLTVNIVVPDNFTGETAGDGIQVYVDKPTSTDPAWIDDFLFHSRVTGSGMNVYDQKTGRVLATLSANNFATKYIYNDAGQVTEVWKEVLGDTWGKWVKVESRDFNFKRAME